MVLALFGLLTLCLLFPACEETEDPAGPDSTSQELVGTWVRYSFTVEDSPVISPAVNVFRTNGSGTAWYDDDGTYVSQNYTWTLQGDTLQLELERDGDHTVMVEFPSDNRAIFEHEADGGSWVEEMFRMTDLFDQDVVGDWMMSAQTQDGSEIEPDDVRVTINADGTGSYTDPEETSTFSWCAVEGYLVVLQQDHVGFVMAYDVVGESLALTEIREEGTFVMTFSPFEVQDDIDPDLIGTWVRESIYFGDTYRDIDAVITFNADGTGSGLEEDPESNEAVSFSFTWTAVSAVLTMTEDEGDWESVISYTVNGNKGELSYEMEWDGTTYDIEDTFWKQTGETPDEMLGTWVQSEPYVGDGYYEMEVTFVVDADGSIQIASRYIETGDIWAEETESWTANWSASGDRVLIMDPLSGLGMAYQFAVNGDVAVMDHPSMGMRTFLLNEGTQPEEAIGTWAPYKLTISGEIEETLVMELRLHGDGTAAVVMLEEEDETSEVQLDSMTWVARDNKVLLTTEGSLLCEVIDYTITGDQMTIDRQELMYDESSGSLEPMQVFFAKDSGELNPAAYGTWEKTDETRDGTDYPDYDNVTLVFNDDGTASYTDTSGETEFTWSWAPGSLYAVSSFMADGYRLSQAAETNITDDVLEMTTYLEKEGEVVTLVETFARL